MSEKSILIETFEKEDLSKVLKLEEEIFVDPWSKMSFIKETEKKDSYYIVAKEKDEIVAYAGIWHVFEEGHVMNIAVKKSSRGRGIGRKLLEDLILKAKEIGLRGLTLEVRIGNKPAYNLYESLGFVEVGVRKDYYRQPREDGVIMWNYF